MAPAKIVSDIDTLIDSPESSQTQANTTHAGRFSLDKKTFLVTGGGRGLGITLASAVLEAGGNVACVDLLDQPDPVEWAGLKKIVTAKGLYLSYHRCDVTKEQDLAEIFDSVAREAENRGAPFHGAIACAGVQQRQLAVDYDPADYERILRVNVMGVFLTAKHSARVLIKNQAPGSIVLVASMSGQIANRGLYCTAYNTSKAAVQQMCRSVSQEWGRYGIRVNSLSPGYIRTAMTDQLLEAEPELERQWMSGALLGRLGAPEDFKAPTVFMLSSGSSWMTGADLRVDGGHCATA